MDDIFWLIMLFPIAWPFIAKHFFKANFTWAEMSINIIAVVLISGVIWKAGSYSQIADTEIWSGQVTKKEMEQQSCPWGWTSFKDGFCTEYRTREVKVGESCSTDSKGNRSCTPIYETEYNYDFPWERKWWVETDLKHTFQIRRIDRQGAKEPPRWTQVSTGDPVAREMPYVNYIQAAGSSLFHSDIAVAEKYADSIPAQPKVYDYYNIDRVQAVGVAVPDLAAWNRDIADLQRTLGPKKQANVNIIFTSVLDPKYLAGVKAAWQGFEKNDIVIAVGLDGDRIAWADADSWSRSDFVNVSLRDRIAGLGTLDRTKFMEIVSQEVNTNFDRRPMAEFEYLKDEIDPPTWAIVLALIFAFVGSPAMTWFFNRPGVDIRFPFEKR